MAIAKEHPVLIVEDELLIAEHISRVLKSAGFVNSTIAISVEEAVEAINKQKPKIVLTDIMLGTTRTGIDLGALLHSHYKIPFVYITSHSGSEMLSKAKHTHPNAYLVKPFKKEDLLIAIELALFNSELSSETNEGNCLLIKDGHAMAQVAYADILWMEAEGNYTLLCTNNNKKRLVRNVITELHQQVPATDFIRVHRSYVVNKKFITEIRHNHVIVNGVEIPVGRTYRKTLDEQFKQA